MMNIGSKSAGLRRGSVWLLAFTGMLALCATAQARPGTHGPSMSTWDTRASSVVLQSRLGFMDDGHFNTFSYNANFTSTTGRLSAQFGLHYLNLKQTGEDESLHGASASATAVMSMPVTDRYDNGVPTAAVAFYMGAVPAVLTTGQINDITLPLVVGLGIPVSPADWITITPWVEPSVSGNLDTDIKSFDLGGAANDELADLQSGMVGADELSEDAVGDIVDESVEVEFSANLGLRSGLAFAFHLGTGADLNIGVGLSSLGGAFSGPMIVTAGGALVWRWDDIVPSILPGAGQSGCRCAQDAPAAPPAVAEPDAAAPAPATAPAVAPAPKPKPMGAPAPAPKPMGAPAPAPKPARPLPPLPGAAAPAAPAPAPALPTPTPSPQPEAPAQGPAPAPAPAPTY